jgi:hypothetical protein
MTAAIFIVKITKMVALDEEPGQLQQGAEP